MRLVLFLNNWGGWQIARWLRTRGEEIVGVVVQPPEEQRFAHEILTVLRLPAERTWLSCELGEQKTVARFRALAPDLGISAWFGHLLKPELFNCFSRGCINLHTAFLPYNRGWHTNVWPILDGSPAGVTIHHIDAGVDTGDLITQRRVDIEPTTTGGELHQMLIYTILDLFKVTWPLIKSGQVERVTQDHAKATLHKKADLPPLDCIDLAREFTAGQLINLLRARTYPPYPAAYFVKGSERVYVRVQFSVGEIFSPEANGQRLEPSEIRLDKLYTGRELLGLLGVGPNGRVPASAYFRSESKTIHIRGEVVAERDIIPSANPPWIPAAS